MSTLGKQILAPRIFRSVGSYYLHDVVSMLTAFMLQRWLVHYFGKDQYGFMTAIASAVGFMMLLDFGLGQTITKYVAEHAVRDERQELNEVVNTTLAMYLGLGLLGLVVALPCAAALHHVFELPGEFLFIGRLFFLVAALKTCIGLPLSVFGGVCFGMGRVDLYNASRLLSVVLNFLLVIGAMGLGANLAQMEGATVVVPVAGGLISLVWIRRLFPEVEFSRKYINRRIVGKLLRFSVFFMINQLIVLLVFHTDNFIIGSVLGVGAVTAYALTQRLVEAGMQVTFKLSDSLYPTWSGHDATGNVPRLRQIYLMATRYSMAVAFVATALVLLYGKWALYAWVGPVAYAGPLITYTLALIIALHTPIHVASGLIAACGQLRRITPWSIAEGVLNLALSLWWVRTLDLWGVALATLISMAVTTGVVVPGVALRLVELSPLRYLRRGIAPGLLAALPVWVGADLLLRVWPCASSITALWHTLLLMVLFTPCLLLMRQLSKER